VPSLIGAYIARSHVTRTAWLFVYLATFAPHNTINRSTSQTRGSERHSQPKPPFYPTAPFAVTKILHAIP
jgi:hypothetical protein